jgi:vacuolar-type H+-ATPase subunit I/STV1
MDWENLVEKMVRWQWAMTAMVVAIGIGIWLVLAKSLPSQLPLFYSRPWGEEQLAGSSVLWLPLAIAIMVAVLVTLVTRKLRLEKVLAAMLIAAGTITEVILLLAVLRIVVLVT